MIRPARVLKDYQESGALNALINFHAAIGPNTFVTKSGDLLAVLAVPGIDDECLDTSDIEQITHRFQMALSVFNDKFRVYQYLLKRDQLQHSVPRLSQPGGSGGRSEPDRVLDAPFPAASHH